MLPEPIFDTLNNLLEPGSKLPGYVCQGDFDISRLFLLSYRGSEDTFNSYRREVDRFLQWAYLEGECELSKTTRGDIENYLRFCNNPPKEWIATTLHPRFTVTNDIKRPNPLWRPFLAKISKAKRTKGELPNVATYALSDSAKKATLRILSSYFSFLETEEFTEFNPVKRIRQKSQFIRSRSGPDPVRRLSVLQWDYVLDICTNCADESPEHERGLFVITCLYSMYLRISELAKSDQYTPEMKDFHKDYNGLWWFRTVGKGNKERDISVSDDMLSALIRYRLHLNLSKLPNPSDDHPLLSRRKGGGAISSTRQIRTIVQFYFDAAQERLIKDNLQIEADELSSATTHWLRHTGISDDVQIRPKEHVRDDAGHASSAITDRYIDIERTERHLSAKNKKNRPD
jgi:site-specific recombinase XerD